MEKKDQLWDRKTLLKFRLNASVFVCFMLQTFALMKTEAFSRNVGKVSSIKVGVRKLIIPVVLCSSGHPVWNLRTKTPNNEQTTVPWHQDNAYLDPSALHTLQPTAWVPLIDANVENGCMQASWLGRMYGVRVGGKVCTVSTTVIDINLNRWKVLVCSQINPWWGSSLHWGAL